jgi:HK97 family phage major capsid protein
MASTADSGIRDQLKRIRAQLADLRQRRAEAKKERDAAKEAFAGANFTEDVKLTDTSEFKAAEQAVATVGDLDDEIAAHQASELALLKLLGDNESTGNGNGNGAHAETLGGVDAGAAGWNGHRLLASSEAYADARSRGLFSSTGKFGTIELGKLANRDEALNFLRSRSMAAELPAAPAGPILSGSLGGAIQPDHRGIVQPNLMSLSLLDMVPTGTTDSNSIEYVQVTAIPGTSDVVAEGSIKAQVGLTLADATAPVRTIAGWIKVQRAALDDAAGLGSMLNMLLPFDVRRKVLAQILNGNGTGQNLTGIYNTVGVGQAAAEADDNIADVILRAITVIVLSDGEPNFAALNPITWQNLLLMKNANGNYIYGNPGQLPGGMVAQTIWGLVLTTSRAVPATKPLVGDSMGCSLLVREGVNVKTSDSDQDDFVRNRVTILAETRVAFPVWRPSSFAIADLAGVAGDESDE